MGTRYIVNDAVSTAWKRMAESKTTYVILAFVLAKAELLFNGNQWQTADAWREFVPYVFGGVALIMIRSGIKKSELASNALNPDVDVEAVTIIKG